MTVEWDVISRIDITQLKHSVHLRNNSEIFTIVGDQNRTPEANVS